MQTSYSLIYLFHFTSATCWRFLLCNAVTMFTKSDSLTSKAKENCRRLETGKGEGCKVIIFFTFTFPAEVEAQDMLLLIPHTSSFCPLIQILTTKTFERWYLTLPGLL